MRSLTLGYNFDLKKYNIKNLRVFLAGENLFTITNYSGVDPELPLTEPDGKGGGGQMIRSTGVSVYPMVRKYMFGASVTF
jgi:hypothetical protein